MSENEEIATNKPLKGQVEIGEEKSKAIVHKDSALRRLDISFNKHIELSEYKKSNLLAYWITDFSNYHDNEKTFDIKQLKTFKRGDIIKVNLGFNIGNELGGLHYCIVLNKNDNPYSGTLNIIPLTSQKKNKIYNDNTCVNLGDGLYISLNNMCNKEYKKWKEKFDNVDKEEDIKQLEKILQELEYLTKLQTEILKMKHESIALVQQITTISKQRIYNSSFLSKIKLSNQALDLIDSKIKKLYTK